MFDPFPKHAHVFNSIAASAFSFFIPHLDRPLGALDTLLNYPSSILAFSYFVLLLSPAIAIQDTTAGFRPKNLCSVLMGAGLGFFFYQCIFLLGSGVSARWVSPRVCSILPMNF